MFFARYRGQPVDLLSVEDISMEALRTLQLHSLFDLIALLIEDRLAILFLDAFLGKLPVLDHGALLALADLRTLIQRLVVRHPARVAAALHHELD
ncbi:hypothetical protein D3C85_1230870 [compost metagenome]